MTIVEPVPNMFKQILGGDSCNCNMRLFLRQKREDLFNNRLISIFSGYLNEHTILGALRASGGYSYTGKSRSKSLVCVIHMRSDGLKDMWKMWDTVHDMRGNKLSVFFFLEYRRKKTPSRKKNTSAVR